MKDSGLEHPPSKKPHGRRQTLKKSFANAYVGVSYCIRTQRNLRIHLGITVLVIALAALLRVSMTEFALLVFCIMVVIVVEMFNTALECLVDLVTSDHHTLAKLSKDISAGAVLVASIGAAIVGTIVFLPKLLQLFLGEVSFYAMLAESMGKLI